MVSPKLGIKTVKELVALAKEKPGAIPFASTGIGSPPHLAQELLDASAGVKFLHVPYRGAAPALDRSARRPGAGARRRHAGADRANPGRQSACRSARPRDKRDAILPDVPTLAEQGYPNTDASNWYGAAGAGQDAGGGDRQAQQGRERRR